MDVKSGPGKVFGWFSNLATIAGLMTWFGIAFTYVRFYAGMKTQGYDRSKLPFFSRLQPYAAWYVIIGTLVICFFSGFKVFLQGSWKTSDFITNYLSFVLFPILYFGARYVRYKSPMVDAADMDFITGVAQAQADSYDEPPPRNILEKIWLSLMWPFLIMAVVCIYVFPGHNGGSPRYSCAMWWWGMVRTNRSKWGELGFVPDRSGRRKSYRSIQSSPMMVLPDTQGPVVIWWWGVVRKNGWK